MKINLHAFRASEIFRKISKRFRVRVNDVLVAARSFWQRARQEWLHSSYSTLSAICSPPWGSCVSSKSQNSSVYTQKTVYIASSNASWVATASDNRYNDYVAFVTSNGSSSFTAAVAGSVAVVGRLFLLNRGIVLECSRLRTCTAIVIYGGWLDESNASAMMKPVLYIYETTLSAPMTAVAEGEGRVTPSSIDIEDGRD